MSYYCYTGDVKKLIPNGWKFQKLYANDYKTYYKNDIFMFVISKMILEICNVKAKDQVMLVKFILDNMHKPATFWEHPSDYFKDTCFANYVIQHHKLITHREAMANKIKFHRAFELDEGTPYVEDGFRIDYELVQTIKELSELGGIELRPKR